MTYIEWAAYCLFTMLSLLLVFFFLIAIHAESTVVFDFVLCQTSLARFALFFR